MLHEYGGYTLKTVRHLLLAEAFALYAAVAARYDHAPAGPTYEEAALLAELDQASAKPHHPDHPAWQA